MWTKYCTALSDYTSSQRVGKVEFLRCQDKKLSEAVETQADVQFPVKSLAVSESVTPFISNCAAVWAERQVIPSGSLFMVYIVNLTAPGSTALRALKESPGWLLMHVPTTHAEHVPSSSARMWLRMDAHMMR